MNKTPFNYNDPENVLSELHHWVHDIAELCEAKGIYWCDGSQQEYDSLCELLVLKGTFKRLNPELRPNSYACFTSPSDVARLESATYICTTNRADAGPTNNWMSPNEMKTKLDFLLDGAMKGRMLYVIPFSMGPVGSPYSKLGVELTDSEYVVVNMHIMTRMGEQIYPLLKQRNYTKCIHTVGHPLNIGEADSIWPNNPNEKYVAHFPEENLIISYGSGYGGNALMGKKCMALRLGSVMGNKEGWLAEHMLISGVEVKDQPKTYIAAAFPSACGKTNFAMLTAPDAMSDCKISTIGDDIAWIHKSKDGGIRAINPESGYFGVLPGTNWDTNPNCMKAISKNTIFTNAAITPDGDVWWEGLSVEVPDGLIAWNGYEYIKNSGKTAAHPNARFTVPAIQNPVIDENWDNPEGVHIEAIIFGGRRSKTLPLVYQSFNWSFGVYSAATLSSETTAAAIGESGVVRIDPFAMLPFMGYHMGDYINHWIQFGKTVTNPPRIFTVNWFRKNEKGEFIWPGFGENMRVLKWIIQRSHGSVGSIESPIGWVPRYQDFDWSGFDLPSHDMFHLLMSIDTAEWKKEILFHETLLAKIYDKLPRELMLIRDILLAALWRSPEKWEAEPEVI